MNNKKVVRLTESQLHDIIAESVSQILNEIGNTEKGQKLMHGLASRYDVKGDLKANDYGNHLGEFGWDTEEHKKAEEIRNLAKQRANQASGYDKYADKYIDYRHPEWNQANIARDKRNALTNGNRKAADDYYEYELAKNGYSVYGNKFKNPENIESNKASRRKSVLKNFENA